MKRLRAEQEAKQAECFAKTRTSGHLLGVLTGGDGEPLETAPTASLDDYPAPLPGHTETNIATMDGERCTAMRKWGGWDDDHGAVRFNVEEADERDDGIVPKAHWVLQDFTPRFRDGFFSMAAPSQFDEAAQKNKGGYLRPYKNALDTDELEQQKSVMVVGQKSLHVFFQHCKFVKDLVNTLSIIVSKYRNDLQPYELTFFLGVSAASCTLWHTDHEEHDKANLQLTTLTLLSRGTTSMCIAGREEAWLKEPFDTVAFDPMLYHRSGVTYPHVVKLSIHWCLRRSAGSAGSDGGSGGAGAAGPSSGVEVKKEPGLNETEMEANEEANRKLDEVDGEEGEEAERLRSEAVGEQRVEVKPDPEEEEEEEEEKERQGVAKAMALMPSNMPPNSNAERKRPVVP